MNHRMRTSWIVSSVTFLGLVISAGYAQANWWDNNTAYRPLYPAYRPVYPGGSSYTAASPVVTAQPVQSSGCNTCASGRQACATCAPAGQPMTVNYAPRTWFRSRWVRVPVTAYRPLVVANQPNCAPTTQRQPCTTYRWQLQRVRTYRPLFSWLPWWPRRAAPVVVGSNFAPTSSCGTCAPAATTVPSPAPYYQPPGVSPATTVPSIMSPTVPRSNTPADLRPSLRPAEAPLPGQGATTRRANPASESGSTTFRRLPRRADAARPFSDVTPIPDTRPAPMARESTEDESIPRLLNPRNHTASLRDTQVWAVIPVNRLQADRIPTNRVQQNSARAPSQPARWDDSGWRSAK